MARIIGYGLTTTGEADRYMRTTLDCFKSLCDDVIILCNNASQAEKDLITEYGFKYISDDRTWGKNQNLIKEDFIRNHVAELNPDITICLDMDEVLVNATREKIEKAFETNQAFHIYIVNLWNNGYRSDWSFWNVRMWGWKYRELLGDKAFFKFENRPLHCGLAPKWAYALNVHAPFVLEHHGLKKKEDRMKKIERYNKYDPRKVYRHPSYYQALETDHSEPYNRENVVKLVENHIGSIKQPLHKEPIVRKTGKKVLIIREADGMVFDVEEKQVQHYLTQKYQGEGFRVMKEISAYQDLNHKVPDTHKDECIICGKQSCQTHEI